MILFKRKNYCGLLIILSFSTCYMSCEEDGQCEDTVWYEDLDGDGFGDPDVFMMSCEQPDGYVANDLGSENCETPLTWYRDEDGDGAGDPNVSVTACEQPEGYVSNADDVGAPAGDPSTRLTMHTATDTQEFNYGEYIPEGYGGDTHDFGILISMHGLGENGSSSGLSDAVTKHGPLLLVKEDEWPVSDCVGDSLLVLAPRYNGESGSCAPASFLHDFIDFVFDRYTFNPNRLYLAGLSCGAFAIDNYFEINFPSSPVSASVLISGNFRKTVSAHGCDLLEKRFWGLHGTADGTVNPNNTIEPFEELLGCPEVDTEHIRLDTYPDVGHNAWTRTFDLSGGAGDIYCWMWN